MIAVTFGFGTISYFVIIQFFLFLCNHCVCAIQPSKIRHAIFFSHVGSRGYQVYCGNNWTNLVIHQPVQVSVETNVISKACDPYCCKITITRRDRIGAVTVGHIPRELSWFVDYFLQVGGSVTTTVASIQYRLSPIPEGGLEIPIQMVFSHTSKPLMEKMKLF